MCGIALVVERSGAGVDPDRLVRHDRGARRTRPRRRSVRARRMGHRRGRLPGGSGHRSRRPAPIAGRGAAAVALVDRPRRPPARDPRSPPARAPADARRSRPVARLQRRDLQRRRDPRRAARRRARVPHRGRHRGVPRGVGDVGAGRAHAAERDVGVRRLGRAAAPAVVRARSAGHQAALPGPDVVRRARRLDAGRDCRRARRAPVAARRGDRRVPRHRPARSRRPDVLQRHRPDRRRVPGRDRRCWRGGAPLGAGPDGSGGRGW